MPDIDSLKGDFFSGIGMTHGDYAARILTEASEGAAWEWKCPMRPKGYRSGHERLTFGDELRKLLPRDFEIIQDMGTDTLIVRRTFQEEIRRDHTQAIPGEFLTRNA